MSLINGDPQTVSVTFSNWGDDNTAINPNNFNVNPKTNPSDGCKFWKQMLAN